MSKIKIEIVKERQTKKNKKDKERWIERLEEIKRKTEK